MQSVIAHLCAGDGIYVSKGDLYTDLEGLLQGLSTTFPLSFSISCILWCCNLEVKDEERSGRPL